MRKIIALINLGKFAVARCKWIDIGGCAQQGSAKKVQS
jgi:hypothetical protein